jgi:tetratricopeptide (TPR) repeat protein
MTGQTRRPVVVAFGAVPVLLGLAVWLQVLRDGTPLPTTDEETLYVTRRVAGRLVFAHRSLAADLYWIRAIQYYGGHARSGRAEGTASTSASDRSAATFALLYPLLDITTSLDPRFNIAYRFGGIFLAEPYPYGPGRPDLALALLEKATRVMPDRWQYWEDIGFVYYWDVGDYEKAAEAFNRGADLPGAPWWLRSLAATTLTKGGQRNASRLLWGQLYATSTNAHARETAARRLQQLDALDAIEALQAAIDALAMRTGQQYTRWQALIDAGLLDRLPADPTGTPYVLSPSSRVQLSPRSSLFPLPVEPAARAGT